MSGAQGGGAGWRDEIAREMKLRGETWDDVVASCVPNEVLSGPYEPEHGAGTEVAFTIWTENRVYFPATYDGWEWCESVPRNPDGTRTGAVGGG